VQTVCTAVRAPAIGRTHVMGDAGDPGRAGMCKLFVGNLPSDCNAEELRGAFSPFGPLVDVHMMSPARSRSGQACAFVLYANADAANYAIQSCNHKLKLRAEMLEPITVSFARGPGSSGPRAGGYFGGGAGGAPAGTPGMAGLQDCGAAGAGAAFFGLGQLPGDAAAACAASMPGAAGGMAAGQPVAAVGTVGAGAAMVPGGYGASLAGGSAAYGGFGAYGLPGAGGAYAPAAAQYQPAAAVPGAAATVVPMAAFPQYVQYVQYPQGPTPQFAAQCAQPQYAAAGVQFGVAPQQAQATAHALAQFSQPCAQQYAQAHMTATAAAPTMSVTTTDPQSTQCPAITGSTETPASLVAPGAAVTTTPQPTQTPIQAAVEQQIDPQASSLQAAAPTVQPAVQTQAQPQVQDAQQAQVQPQAEQQPADQTAAGGTVPSAAAAVAPGAAPPAGSAKLLVGNLPGDIAPQTIEMVFATYGKVCSVRILPDKSPTGTSCALVEYETSHSAQVATVTLNGRYEIRVGFGFITVQPGDNIETPGQADQRYKPY